MIRFTILFLTCVMGFTFFPASAQTIGEVVNPQLERELTSEENKIPGKAVLLIYSNTSWSGAIQDGDLRSYTRDGSGNGRFVVDCAGSVGIISVNFQKQTDYGYLVVALIQNGKTLNSAVTTAQYGLAGFAEECSTFGGGCLVVTAAHGTELSPQIQMLREIRDKTLLQTDSGYSFMTGFNDFYYSFSPTIADWERQNPLFKEMVKTAITPMLSTLSILSYTDINSEQEMLGYGLGIILLNLGMYFVVPAFLIMRLKKYASRKS